MTSNNCCNEGHEQVRVSKSRDILGRFTSRGFHQTDIPKQCYLCRNGVHHKCIEPEECGCDCVILIEDII